MLKVVVDFIIILKQGFVALCAFCKASEESAVQPSHVCP